MANVIFDFDGTLADTFPLIVDVSYRLSPGSKRLPKKEIAGLRRLPLLTAMRSLGISRWYLPLLVIFVRRRLRPRMKEVKPYDGVLPALRELHKSGHRLFILTSNYKENAQAFLKHHKAEDLFEGIEAVHFASVFTKARVLKKLIKKHSWRPEDCYYVGNEALDTRSAERVGMRAVATAWGGFNQHELRKTEPYALIKCPSELVDLLQ
jgi:phosphoglycolate phosphatase-like HAD superfamily hydrolase